MVKHHARREKPKVVNERPDIESIVTCSCSHEFYDHSEMGCMKSECECDVERSMMLVGKLQAVDEL